MKKKKIFLIFSVALIILEIVVFIDKILQEGELTWKTQYGLLWILPLLFFAIMLVINYCKNNVKIVLTTLGILAVMYCTIISIDMNRVDNGNKPLLAWQTNQKQEAATNKTIYQGLGYRVEQNTQYYQDGNIESESLTMYMLNHSIAGVSKITVNVHENEKNLCENNYTY